MFRQSILFLTTPKLNLIPNNHRHRNHAFLSLLDCSTTENDRYEALSYPGDLGRWLPRAESQLLTSTDMDLNMSICKATRCTKAAIKTSFVR